MIAAYRRTYSPRQVTWSDRWLPGAVSNGRDDSTINIVLVIIISIIIITQFLM